MSRVYTQERPPFEPFQPERDRSVLNLFLPKGKHMGEIIAPALESAGMPYLSGDTGSRLVSTLSREELKERGYTVDSGLKRVDLYAGHSREGPGDLLTYGGLAITDDTVLYEALRISPVNGFRTNLAKLKERLRETGVEYVTRLNGRPTYLFFAFHENFVEGVPLVSLESLREFGGDTLIRTSWPFIAECYRDEKRLNIEVRHARGSLEIYPALQRGTGILDVAGTGNTMKENKLVPVPVDERQYEVLKSTPIIIANADTFESHKPFISEFADNLAGVFKSMPELGVDKFDKRMLKL